MIQFPIGPPEVFAWWVVQLFCSNVFVQRSPLVFIMQQSCKYTHLNFQSRVCSYFGFIIHESHIETGGDLSSKLFANEERSSEICITNILLFPFITVTDDSYFGTWRLLVKCTHKSNNSVPQQYCSLKFTREHKDITSTRAQITGGPTHLIGL